MQISPQPKKLLLLALFEDVLFILFLSTLIASSMEILLPGILSNRLPLAFLFTLFALLFFFYTGWKQKEGIATPSFSLPPALLFTLGIILFLVTLFMNRDFGFFGAAVQAILILLALFYWYHRK